MNKTEFVNIYASITAFAEEESNMFDFTDPGFLGLMESEGMMDTNEGLISRVSKVLENSPSNVKSYSFCAEQNDD